MWRLGGVYPARAAEADLGEGGVAASTAVPWAPGGRHARPARAVAPAQKRVPAISARTRSTARARSSDG
jgi:hypothetical protein